MLTVCCCIQQNVYDGMIVVTIKLHNLGAIVERTLLQLHHCLIDLAIVCSANGVVAIQAAQCVPRAKASKKTQKLGTAVAQLEEH